MGGAPCGAGGETGGVRCERGEGVGCTGSEASATMGGKMLVTGETVCLITVQSFAMRVETVLYLWYFGVIIIDLMDCIL